jgi:hypothetical protein
VWVKTIVFLLTLDHESTDRCFLYACYGNPNLLHTMHQTTQQQLTQVQQMLHEMQHRYDRLLEAPRSTPPPRVRQHQTERRTARPPEPPERPLADTAADVPQARTVGGQRKLTPRQQRALRDKHQRGVPVPALMEEYGLSRASVFRYLQSEQRAGGE